MSLNMNVKTEKELKLVMEMTEDSRTEQELLDSLLDDAVKKYLNMFRNSRGEIVPEIAYRLPSMEEIKTFAKEYKDAYGKSPGEETVNRFVKENARRIVLLDSTKKSGVLYCTIFDKGDIRKCPMSRIRKSGLLTDRQ